MTVNLQTFFDFHNSKKEHELKRKRHRSSEVGLVQTEGTVKLIKFLTLLREIQIVFWRGKYDKLSRLQRQVPLGIINAKNDCLYACKIIPTDSEIMAIQIIIIIIMQATLFKYLMSLILLHEPREKFLLILLLFF